MIYLDYHFFFFIQVTTKTRGRKQKMIYFTDYKKLINHVMFIFLFNDTKIRQSQIYYYLFREFSQSCSTRAGFNCFEIQIYLFFSPKTHHVTVSAQLLYLIPRLLPEARKSPITGAGLVSDDQEEILQENLWSSTTDLLGTWRKTAQHLWRLPAFRQLQHLSQYQVMVHQG